MPRWAAGLAFVLAAGLALGGYRVFRPQSEPVEPPPGEKPQRDKWRQPFLSANDGGSGVAVLMELANHMKGLKSEVGIDFILFDGEEYIFDPDPGRDKYFFGSEHFAGVHRRNQGKPHYVGAVLLDMIAGKNAHIPAEHNSWIKAQALVQDL